MERRTRSELIDIGRELRRLVPHSEHAGWTLELRTADPLQLLRLQETGRVAELLPLRYSRMAASPFAFYRGSAAAMASDLANTPVTGVNVQACGDAHADNFGGYASPERNVVYDVNDFDETLPAPWELDVKRLAASLVLGGREAGLEDSSARAQAEIATSAYCAALSALVEMTTIDIHYSHLEGNSYLATIGDPTVRESVQEYLDRARRRTNQQAMRKWTEVRNGALRFREEPPILQHLSDQAVDRLHDRYNSYRQTLQVNRRRLLEQYRFRDAAHRVVGVGSVGLRSYVLLLEGRGEPDPLFIQIKQAVSSVLTPYWGPSGYSTHGERVVAGQRIMQAASDPLLGWETVDGDFYVRQLRDMKGPSVFSRDLAVLESGAALVGETLARSHSRSVDPSLLVGYVGPGDSFVSAIVQFASDYADQAERDYDEFVGAIKNGSFPTAG